MNNTCFFLYEERRSSYNRISAEGQNLLASSVMPIFTWASTTVWFGRCYYHRRSVCIV